MKKDSVPKADTQRMQENIKIGKTLFIVNQVFTPNQTKRETWLSIITRAEGLKR